MRLTLALLLLSCGGVAAPDAGSLTWACEHPRCCVGTLAACRDFGCCGDGWKVKP